MTKQQKSMVFSIATVLFLFGVGSGVAHMQDQIEQKANKLELMQLETRFVAESLRTAAFQKELYSKISRIDSTTVKTYDCLSQILNDNRRFCQ
jgi:hypothetical protein